MGAKVLQSFINIDFCLVIYIIVYLVVEVVNSWYFRTFCTGVHNILKPFKDTAAIYFSILLVNLSVVSSVLNLYIYLTFISCTKSKISKKLRHYIGLQ